MKRRKQVQKRWRLPSSQPLPKLPTEIIEEILSRLPLDSLFRFRCVCKSWYHLVKDPYFIKMQLSRANENPKILIAYPYEQFSVEFQACDKTSIVDLHPPTEGLISVENSCNGLVCYVEEARGGVFVWNPFTGDYKKLPDVPDVQSNGSRLFGLGYSSALDEYKVVKLSLFSNEVWVHTLGTHSWRTVDYALSEINALDPGVYLNGALHWILFDKTKPHVILVFDLGDEKFREMLLPDFGNRIMSSRIVLLGGQLCVHYFSSRGDYGEIWVMKEYGNEKSWLKQFSEMWTKFTGRYGQIRILGSTKSGEILLARNKRFDLFNPVDQRIRPLPICGSPYLLEANNYVESLVSPMDDV